MMFLRKQIKLIHLLIFREYESRSIFEVFAILGLVKESLLFIYIREEITNDAFE